MKEIKKMLIGEKERKIYVSETYKDGDPCFIKNIKDVKYIDLGIKKLNQKKIEKLKDVDLEDLDPVILGCSMEEIVYVDNMPHFENLYIVDGHHRLESRKYNELPFIIRYVICYETKEDMIKELIQLNLSPKNTFTEEDLNNIIFKILSKEYEKPKEDRRVLYDIYSEYYFPMENLYVVNIFFELQEKLRESDTKSLELLKKMPLPLLEGLEPLMSISRDELITFLVLFKEPILETINRKRLKKEIKMLRECSVLYSKKLISNFKDYLELINYRDKIFIPKEISNLFKEMHFSTEKHSYRPSNPLSLITPEDELIMKNLYKWEIRGWLKKSASFFL